jgi:hypothetical protein
VKKVPEVQATAQLVAGSSLLLSRAKNGIEDLQISIHQALRALDESEKLLQRVRNVQLATQPKV